MNLGASLLLIALITVSAFGVIYIKYQNRFLNIEISKNEKKLFESSDLYRELLKEKTILTDKKLQRNSLGGALSMQLPPKERILIMKLKH